MNKRVRHKRTGVFNLASSSLLQFRTHKRKKYHSNIFQSNIFSRVISATTEIQPNTQSTVQTFKPSSHTNQDNGTLAFQEHNTIKPSHQYNPTQSNPQISTTHHNQILLHIAQNAHIQTCKHSANANKLYSNVDTYRTNCTYSNLKRRMQTSYIQMFTHRTQCTDSNM